MYLCTFTLPFGLFNCCLKEKEIYIVLSLCSVCCKQWWKVLKCVARERPLSVDRGVKRTKGTTAPMCSLFVGHGDRVPEITLAWGRRVEGEETTGVMRDKYHRRVVEMPSEKKCSYRD